MQRAPSAAPALAGYEFVKLLGTGGFSDVFLYDQKLPRRPVAVKVLLLEELTAASQAAFAAEANLMAQLSTHPYIVTIYHADVADDGRPYFVMEYCSGPSLADRYKERPFAVDDALRTGVRIASAIATAHGAGILHRDIKPANVLTNDFGWPALTDFGISSAVDTELPMHTTTLGGGSTEETTGSQSVGMSIPWSPPEMFDDDPQPDVRSDVFSLAATVHTLLAGRTPFEVPGRSNGTLDIVGRIERGAITPIGREDIPASLTAVLAKGMASHRSDRYASAVEFGRALQRVELELGYAPTDLNVPTIGAHAARSDADDGAGETRVRQVATIEAQAPVYIEPPAAPPSAGETRVRPVAVVQQPAADSTVLRGPVPVVEQTIVRPAAAASEPVLDSTGPPEQPRSRRGLLIGLVSAGVLVVVAAIVAVSLIVAGAGVRSTARPTTTPTSDGGAAVVVGAVPAPVGGTAVRDGADVVFAWKNPDPVAGDAFQYALAESPSHVFPLDVPTVSVPVGDAARQCIDAYILRAGQRSSDPLEICYGAP